MQNNCFQLIVYFDDIGNVIGPHISNLIPANGLTTQTYLILKCSSVGLYAKVSSSNLRLLSEQLVFSILSDRRLNFEKWDLTIFVYLPLWSLTF